jgi:hypothetical protein
LELKVSAALQEVEEVSLQAEKPVWPVVELRHGEVVDDRGNVLGNMYTHTNSNLVRRGYKGWCKQT